MTTSSAPFLEENDDCDAQFSMLLFRSHNLSISHSTLRKNTLSQICDLRNSMSVAIGSSHMHMLVAIDIRRMSAKYAIAAYFRHRHHPVITPQDT